MSNTDLLAEFKGIIREGLEQAGVSSAVCAVAVERQRQDELVADGSIPIDCTDPDVSDATKLLILAEEFGEVARAINDHEHIAILREELIQTAAVAVAWAESL
jgi:hypothetical protein